MPVRVWDTFVSDQNNFFLAVTYATDNGAEVIAGRRRRPLPLRVRRAGVAVRLRPRRGAGLLRRRPQHRQPQLPGRLRPRDAHRGRRGRHRGPRARSCPSRTDDPGHQRRRSSTCSSAAVHRQPWPPMKHLLPQRQHGPSSAASRRSRCTGPTGSTNTGKAAGAAALVISAAHEDRASTTERPTSCGRCSSRRPRTCCRATPAAPGTPDPARRRASTPTSATAAPTWARPSREAATGRIPPEASIASPDWYAPVTGAGATITGLADARERRRRSRGGWSTASGWRPRRRGPR